MNNKTLWRFVVLFVLVGGLFLNGCHSSAQDRWAVYVYMCGTDLESEAGAATANLAALQQVKLPENIKFFIQTGGAANWQHESISSDTLGRYVYDHTGWHEIDQLDDASMGDEETLEEFLRFAREEFPAERRMLIFWDHGGGSLGGFCWDEKFDQCLNLNALRQALENVNAENPRSPFFDLVLFDTCLMANIETANTLYGFARYMAASEENMPETGTDYAGWVGALAKNPAMDGQELGKVICDTYLPYCRRYESDNLATLSLIDLAKLPALNDAYENMGQEALQESRRDPQYFFTAFDRIANGVENYGTNDGDEWTNMIDLGALAQGVGDFATAPALTQAIKNAVVCRTAGTYRRYGMGLSGYYSLDGSLDSWQAYNDLAVASPAFSELYLNMLSGNGDGVPWFHFDAEKIANVPITFDSNNIATVRLSPEEVNSVSNVSFLLCYYDAQNNLVYLGSDDKLETDWEQGVFRDNFDGMWPALNGHFLPLELSEQQPDYNLYVSYILLNGHKCYLTIAYNFAKEEFEILGAQRILPNGWLDRPILQLKQGDQITPLFIDEHDREISGESFTLETAPVLRDELLPDDIYAFAFRFDTTRHDAAISDTIHFIMQDGKLSIDDYN